MYKLIALDMDGTLLNSNKEISHETYLSLKKANDKGYYICLSTGRGLAELKDYNDQLDIISYGILISGGCLYDFKLNKIIYEKCLNKELIKDIINITYNRDIMIQVLTSQYSIVENNHVKNMDNYHMSIYKSMYERVTIKKDNIREYVLNNNDNIIKINLYHINEDERNKTYNKLKHLPLSLAFSEETSLEITPLNINKGEGLRYLRELLNINKDETIVIGDGDNDIEILKEAGLSVAMGNANDNVKAITNTITLDNDHDGIKVIVDKYM